ncbi:unnamed protein product [Bathycoccus prasinos]
MTASSFSKGGKGGEEVKEEDRNVMSRAEFVSNLIKAMEMSNERNDEEEDDDDDSSKVRTAKKCAEKMRFDYPQLTRKELERLSESIDKDGRRGLVFDSKVLENIALGATKADDANSNTNSSIDGVGSKDAHRKLAIQVFAEFPLRMMGDDEMAAREAEAILVEVDFSEEEEAEMDEPGLEDVVAFAEESGVEKATTAIEKNSSESNGGVAAKDDDSTDDDDDSANWLPLEMNGLNTTSNGEMETQRRHLRTFTRIEKVQFLLRKLTPALIGADDYSRVFDGSAPYVSRKTTETLTKLFENISEKIQSSDRKNSGGDDNLFYRAMRSAAMNCLRSRFLVSPNDIVANECLKRILKSLRFGEYAKRSALEKKMNGDDGAKEDELDSLALLAHLAVRFAEKNALGVNFSVFGQLENSASSSSNLSNARRAFAPLVADSLLVIAARFWSFAGTEKDKKGNDSMANVDEEDTALNACALLLSYVFTTSDANAADGMILNSGCIASLAAYFSAKGVLKIEEEEEDNASSYFAPGSAAARRCISLGIASSKATREYFSKAPMCVSASKLDTFVNSSHGVVWSLAVDADEEEAVKRMKHISSTHANSIEMLNTILLVSACFASANTKNNALWQRKGAFHQTLAEILASTKEVEKCLVEDAKRRVAERRGQNERKQNDSDDDEEDKNTESVNASSLSDAKIDPELEKARDIATLSSRVLKDLVAASTLGDVAAIRKSD